MEFIDEVCHRMEIKMSEGMLVFLELKRFDMSVIGKVIVFWSFFTKINSKSNNLQYLQHV